MMLESLGSLLVRRKRLVLAVCVVLVAAAGAFGGPIVGLLDAEDDFDDPSTESIRAHDALRDATGVEPGTDLVAVVRLGAAVDVDPAPPTASRRGRRRVSGADSAPSGRPARGPRRPAAARPARAPRCPRRPAPPRPRG